jgi:hypothetical protein
MKAPAKTATPTVTFRASTNHPSRFLSALLLGTLPDAFLSPEVLEEVVLGSLVGGVLAVVGHADRR